MRIESFQLVSIQIYPRKRFLSMSRARRTTLCKGCVFVDAGPHLVRFRPVALAPASVRVESALEDCAKRMARIQWRDSHASYETPNVWIHQHSCLTRHVRADPPVCLFAHKTDHLRSACHSAPTLFYLNYEVLFHFAQQDDRDHWSSQWFVPLSFFHTRNTRRNEFASEC